MDNVMDNVLFPKVLVRCSGFRMVQPFVFTPLVRPCSPSSPVCLSRADLVPAGFFPDLLRLGSPPQPAPLPRTRRLLSAPFKHHTGSGITWRPLSHALSDTPQGRPHCPTVLRVGLPHEPAGTQTSPRGTCARSVSVPPSLTQFCHARQPVPVLSSPLTPPCGVLRLFISF